MSDSFTRAYPSCVVQAAQVLGTRVTGDQFFPKWKVNKAAEEGELCVTCFPGKYIVRMQNEMIEIETRYLEDSE